MKISIKQVSLSRTLNHVNYDQVHGKGAVPYNQEVDYMGREVLMRPSDFLTLAKPLSRERADSVDFLKQYIKEGNAIGSPFLFIDIQEDKDADEWQPTADGARVVGHEGRNRAYAIQELYGDVPMLVHLLYRGGFRNKHVSNDVLDEINHYLIPEGKTIAIKGPFWKPA